jgi:nitrogen regulatory protein PII
MANSPYKVIFTVINKGDGADVIDATKKAGAFGGTIIPARGSGVQDGMKFFGLQIDPEKEIVMTLVESSIAERVTRNIVKEMDLDKPGKGICFVIDVGSAHGLSQK